MKSKFWMLLVLFILFLIPSTAFGQEGGDGDPPPPAEETPIEEDEGTVVPPPPDEAAADTDGGDAEPVEAEAEPTALQITADEVAAAICKARSDCGPKTPKLTKAQRRARARASAARKTKERQALIDGLAAMLKDQVFWTHIESVSDDAVMALANAIADALALPTPEETAEAIAAALGNSSLADDIGRAVARHMPRSPTADEIGRAVADHTRANLRTHLSLSIFGGGTVNPILGGDAGVFGGQIGARLVETYTRLWAEPYILLGGRHQEGEARFNWGPGLRLGWDTSSAAWFAVFGEIRGEFPTVGPAEERAGVGWIGGGVESSLGTYWFRIKFTLLAPLDQVELEHRWTFGPRVEGAIKFLLF